MINPIDFTLHIDKYLIDFIQVYGIGVYVILFLVIFLETGLVITPFLPGDSLIFAAGAFAANGSLNVILLFIILCFAAIIGDSLNYWIGNYFGEKVLESKKLIKKEYVERTQEFYEKQGGKAIALGRFIPIIRTFVPFVAGIGKMKYKKFLYYNVLGGIVWVALFLFGGYFFGGLSAVKDHFTLVILAIIFISIIPVLYEVIKGFRKKKRLSRFNNIPKLPS